jgi:hypothetical protein
MKVTMVERNCADCPLRAMQMIRGQDSVSSDSRLDAEDAPERQLEQLERSFGADWKW